MEYQHSDIFLFYGVIIFFVILYIRRNKRSAGNAAANQRSANQTGQSRGAGAPLTVQNAAGDDVKGVFVVVTSADPQTQLMAMSLSTQVLTKGKSVQILLCGPGGDLALKNGKEVVLKPLDKSPQALMKGLMGNGVKVEVCPFYLPNKGGTPADLTDGITIAAPPAVADGLIEPGIKLFTF
jgi:predicted peroxiredoxin